MTATETREGRLAALLANDPTAMADPYPLWRSLREAAPVVEAGPIYWVTRYDAAKSVIRDSTHFSSDSNRRGTVADHLRSQLSGEQRVVFDRMWDIQSLFMVATDGEQHVRLRRVVHRAFTPRRIAELEAATTRYVEKLATQLGKEETGDLMELAYRVPLMIIGDLLGVPAADRDLIKEWSNTWAANRVATDDRLFVAWKAMQDFRAYVEEMIEDHRRAANPSGLVSALIGAEQDERLTHDELAANFFALLFAGHETTTNLIGTGMLELFRNPAQWRLLVTDPSGVAPLAAEELLRYVSPVQWLPRIAVDATDIAGTRIPVAATVYVALAAANRDPDVFADPEELILTRANAGSHLALGFGEHFCLGASLARLEATIALRTLATRFPQMELAADPDTLEWCGHALLRRLKALPVRANASLRL